MAGKIEKSGRLHRTRAPLGGDVAASTMEALPACETPTVMGLGLLPTAVRLKATGLVGFGHLRAERPSAPPGVVSLRGDQAFRLDLSAGRAQPAVLARFCLKCRSARRLRHRLKCAWLPQYNAYLHGHYQAACINEAASSELARQTGFPRWYVKRQARRLGLSMQQGSSALDSGGT